ncbi:DUF6491 family protein [Sphingomonas lacunae]|uniref:DUF6491 family protein n=1 Tax=Sphingomonas lacunae TaxID=2698828 RepID=UPI0031B57DE0
MRALVISSAALLGACAPIARTNAEALTPDQLALLDRNLSGKVAGEPVSCINNLSADQTIRVSDNILLYRVSGRLVYKNELRGGCPGLARDNDVIVSEVRGSGPCRGDIIHLVDRTTGIRGPSCVLGDFTPYRAPPG